MSLNSSHSSLSAIAAALNSISGYVTLVIDGEEYVVVKRQDFERLTQASDQGKALDEEELSDVEEELGDTAASAINRTIALEMQDGAIDEDEASMPIPELTSSRLATRVDDLAIPPDGKRVRFEPLRGDLAPDLQD